MEQPDFFAIPSPCIGVCRANNKGYCIPAPPRPRGRGLPEQMNDDQKHQVMRLLAVRRKKIEQAKWEKGRDFGTTPEQENFEFD